MHPGRGAPPSTIDGLHHTHMGAIPLASIGAFAGAGGAVVQPPPGQTNWLTPAWSRKDQSGLVSQLRRRVLPTMMQRYGWPLPYGARPQPELTSGVRYLGCERDFSRRELG